MRREARLAGRNIARKLLYYASFVRKLSISAVGVSKKLRRLSRMRYHDLTKVAGIYSGGLILLAEFETLSSGSASGINFSSENVSVIRPPSL